MSATVFLLCWQAADAVDEGFTQIADFAGAVVSRITIDGDSFEPRLRTESTSSEPIVVAVAARTLREIFSQYPDPAKWCAALLGQVNALYVFGLTADSMDTAALRALSSSPTRAVQSPPASKPCYTFGTQDSGVWRWFSKLSFKSSGCDNSCNTVFDSMPEHGIGILSRDGSPVFMELGGMDGKHVFLTTLVPRLDLDSTVGSEDSLTKFLPALLPPLIFLRAVLGNRVWQPTIPQAALIIDDPFLRNRYGFFNYQRLLSSVEGLKCSTNIAFIPWNYRRSRASTIDLFRRHTQALALCVHGCDHTRSEFGGSDESGLRWKTARALIRMSDHEGKTGIPWQRIMVFPQGVFSTVAMKVLKEFGFLAAVNTSVHAVDAKMPIKVRDILNVATSGYSGLPLFSRNYPRQPVDFALNLFLGKPAFIVEHHDYFRHGYASLQEFLRMLQSMEPQLEWGSLHQCCTRAHLIRKRKDEVREVRYFTNKFTLTNSSDTTKTYELINEGASPTAKRVAFIDGEPLKSATQGDDRGAVCLELRPGESAVVSLEESCLDPRNYNRRASSLEATRFFVRRFLSDVRDDYVSKLRR